MSAAWIDGDCPRHQALWPLVAPRMPADEPAHDALHVARVYRWTLRLADAEGLDRDTAGAAALLHDVVLIDKDEAARSQAATLSAAAGAELLPAVGYEPAEAEPILAAVAACSWSSGAAPPSPIAAVLQDADRLDALGVVGFARLCCVAQQIASKRGQGRLYDPADPLAAGGRELDDRLQAVDHCFVKLRHLPTGMHTALARAEGERRWQRLEALLADLVAECCE